MYEFLFGKLFGVIPIPGVLVILLFAAFVVVGVVVWAKDKYLIRKIIIVVVISVTILMVVSSLVSFFHKPLSTENIVLGIFCGICALVMQCCKMNLLEKEKKKVD